MLSNKCIGDDTKAAARQSLNSIKNKKIYNMAKNYFQYCGWNSYTLQCGTIMTLISPGDCTLQRGMWLWNRDSEFAQTSAILAAPCKVTRGSAMTCHWIRPNVRHIGILHLVSISTTSSQSTCHSAPVSEILSKSDHPWQKKWHVDFQDGGSQPI